MRPDLFALADGAAQPTVDFWNLMAIEKYGCPAGWRWTSLEHLGGVFLPTFKSGPRAGQVKRAQRFAQPGTWRELVITFAAFDAFLAEWEGKKTGKCHKCSGSGQELAGWNISTGDRLAQCTRCKGTGAKQ